MIDLSKIKATDPETGEGGNYLTALMAYVELVKTRHGSFAQTVTVAPGRSFDKIVINGNTTAASVHSFIAKVTKTTKSLGSVTRGDIMKAATWKAPAKHPRGNIFDNPESALTPDGFVRYL